MIVVIISIAMGFLLGLGVGGGKLLIPALVLLLGITQQIAQGTTLAVFLPISLIAIITHMREKNMSYTHALYLVIGSVVGAYLGAKIASNIDTDHLRKIYGGFMLIIGAYEMVSKDPKTRLHYKKPKEA
ncbi:hypothetical protein BHU72_01860 [Desulfuribacillus stibiiarsenatis]|uniref:Probable membrane transporter protein n=2 Tax=Desulfuribacillus stibiiarsenatis TaxID=1390249 RepID=A0A1E5LAH8_9FIRM|nr:hypothetical protein BHU72_01860 [Desulfuribacillus stibiiarsenatis]